MKDYRVYLGQILERIDEFTRKGRDIFMANKLLQDAVIRNFEVIGEASKRLPPEFRDQHPEIPWRRITAFRDVLIHAYDRVDLQEVWRIIKEELPPLKKAISAILPPLEQLEREVAGEEEPERKS
jgi:uncharacterized protein with HEPN domain